MRGKGREGGKEPDSKRSRGGASEGVSRGEEGGDGASERVRELANEGGCWTRGEGGGGGEEREASKQARERAKREGSAGVRGGERGSEG